MKKIILIIVVFCNLGLIAQTKNIWKAHKLNDENIIVYKGALRASFPKQFLLFDLDITPLRQALFSIVDNAATKKTTVSLPNADGQIEAFEVNEASNFEPDLQARFPEIRAFSGRGLTDRYATLKLSISPQGIQTMIFRTDKPTEFIEAYSNDKTIYAVFKSQRDKGNLSWSCFTNDEKLFFEETDKKINKVLGNNGQLKTMRLAQSCNGEYSNYFGATSAAQVALVLAAFNATLTRGNGCYEKDLGLHLNLVSSSTNVIYYNPTSDPYSALRNWNTELQKALNTTLTGTGTSLANNNAAYDIGHMFGASGGGGSAGCIGCVCVGGSVAGTGSTKGRGITSPADGVPMGDNFDIDYVVHEIGHQLGGNHTFSFSNEGAGVNKEVGSGITIMAYAGITPYDLTNHSIDIFHQTSIEQIQANLATRSCPVTTNISAANATPVANAGADYTIPISTPFALIGSGTDANIEDALTYCWEQNDDGESSIDDASTAFVDKAIGPNFLSWSPTASATRVCPKMETVLINAQTTSQVRGDAGKMSEALSSINRTLNFRLTVRDNCPYSSAVPLKVGQTAFDDMVVTVSTASSPFTVTSQNTTGISYAGLTTQTVTWNAGNTAAAPFNAANVKISLSTDNFNFPTVLIASTANDGSETVTIPNGINATSCRIKVEAIGNIFFNVNTTTFAITPSLSTENFDLADFSLFPNPNKGTFTVKFNSNSSNDINIAIHDIQGRLILDKKYNNTGIFNQEIQLNNAQAGVYLVTTQDGDKKVVKRIIVQ